jgi:hypothetical protein
MDNYNQQRFNLNAFKKLLLFYFNHMTTGSGPGWQGVFGKNTAGL